MQYPLRLTFIQAWMSNHMVRKMWDEISYSFSNFNHGTTGVSEYTFYNGYDHLSMLWFKLIMSHITGGNCSMVVAATIVIMAVVKKAQKNVLALYHSYNLHHLPRMHLDFRLSFQDCPCGLPVLFDSPLCNNGRRKIWLWPWLHHFDFQHWRWLHVLMTMVTSVPMDIFWYTHNWTPGDKYVYRLYACCQVWYV